MQRVYNQGGGSKQQDSHTLALPGCAGSRDQVLGKANFDSRKIGETALKYLSRRDLCDTGTSAG
jgi:hypothetical protein